jgi:hypothetical protein
MQASPKAEQVKDMANAEIPAFAGMTEEKFSQLSELVSPASSFVGWVKRSATQQNEFDYWVECPLSRPVGAPAPTAFFVLSGTATRRHLN